MDSLGSLKFATCECCLSKYELRDLCEEIEAFSLSYAQLLTACFAIEIQTLSETDLTSQSFICESCAVKLKDCYLFRCQINESQSHLRIIGDNSNAVISINENDDVDIFNYEYLSEDDLCLNENSDDVNDEIFKSDYLSEDDSPLTFADVNNIDIFNDKPPVRHVNDQTKSQKRSYYKAKRAKMIPFKLEASALNCNLCRENFSTHKALVSHMATHYPNFVCDLCGKSFVLHSCLRKHMNTHKVEKDSCPVCQKEMKKSSLPRHLKNHSGQCEVYACPHCALRFATFRMRLKHMADEHNVDIFRHHCKICSKKFNMASSLAKHVRRCHFQELNVTCSECGKGFFDRNSLKEHMLKHTGEKRFQCDLCTKAFSRRSAIKEHMKIHYNIKAYKCTICDKSFVQKCSLKAHNRTHIRNQDIEEI